ncbi:MAG TPA: MASE1 domain-containing protein [Burkholderiales bacterium]|nr:MASE1 domain-containing protein [Burkholderiales bacterium]
MSAARYLRAAAVFAPCYIVLDWASYLDPLGPFNITPWNPQPAVALAWLLLAGFAQVPAVFAAIVAADVLVRGAPGGPFITLVSGAVLAGSYAALAWMLRELLRGGVDLRTTRELTLFVAVTVVGTAITGAAFVGVLRGAELVPQAAVPAAWLRFWIGDAVGILVTAPLLFAVADPVRRDALIALARKAETWAQAGVLVAALWLIFAGLPGDPAQHFYILFVPVIWIAARAGMNGAVVATALVQLGVVVGIHRTGAGSLPVLELQALVATLALAGLYLGMVVDERQRAADNLRRSLRLAAAGEMAGALAHEVNQPLTALSNYGRSALLVLENESARAQLQAIIEKMLGEAERAAEVVRRLRDFFRAGTTRLEAVPVEELLAAVRRIGQSVIGERRVALEVRADAELSPLYVDRLQVELVLRNLIANSVDAVQATPGGRIEVSVAPEDARRARIVVADNGPGVAAARREAVFEPLSSGKPSGMGLGLAVSRAIAEAHGGSLEAHGGEFRLILPCLPR